jgi:multidrug efflux pump
MSANNDIEKDLHGPERQFAITSWAVKNRTTVIVLTLLICVMGIRAYLVMPKVSFPEVVTPGGVHRHTLQQQLGGGHREADHQAIEKELNTITGVDEIKSTSVPNFSSIHIKFTMTSRPPRPCAR